MTMMDHKNEIQNGIVVNVVYELLHHTIHIIWMVSCITSYIVYKLILHCTTYNMLHIGWPQYEKLNSRTSHLYNGPLSQSPLKFLTVRLFRISQHYLEKADHNISKTDCASWFNVINMLFGDENIKIHFSEPILANPRNGFQKPGSDTRDIP